jgi:glycosyltransferase 2 family protein
MKKRLFAGFAVAALCLYFAFRGISFPDLAKALSAAKGRWIAAALGVYLCGYLLRAYRWHFLIRPIKRIPSAELLGPMILGFFANNILPFRMGEFIRAHLTGRKFSISRTASLGTILLERLCDTFSFLATFVAAACFFPFPASAERGAAVMAAICVGLVVCLFIGMPFAGRVERTLDRAHGKLHPRRLGHA